MGKTSTKNNDHWTQNVLTQRFQPYNENWAYPDNHNVDEYDLSAITEMPISLYVGKDDGICTEAWAEVLADSLSTLQYHYLFPGKDHGYFVAGNGATYIELLHNEIGAELLDTPVKMELEAGAQVSWSLCRNDQDASWCNTFCNNSTDYGFLTVAQVNVSCIWANVTTNDMSESDVFYTECQDNNNIAWCTYACIDARDNGNSWYFDYEKEEACANETFYDDGPTLAEAANSTWSACRNDQDLDACYDVYYSGNPLYDSDSVRQAGKWLEASMLDEWVWYYQRCVNDRDLDWCEWSCVDATNGNIWYTDAEKEFACNPSWDETET